MPLMLPIPQVLTLDLRMDYNLCLIPIEITSKQDPSPAKLVAPERPSKKQYCVLSVSID